MPAEAAEEMRSPPMMIAGIVLMGTGFVAAVIGIGLIATGATSGDRTECAGRDSTGTCTGYTKTYGVPNEEQQTGGAIVLGPVGGTMLVLGAILTGVGATKVPIEAGPSEASAVTFEPLIGPTSGGLRVTF
jgi:uncharacterized membrane protein